MRLGSGHGTTKYRYSGGIQARIQVRVSGEATGCRLCKHCVSFSYSNGWYQAFQGSLHPLRCRWKHRISSTGKAGFATNVKVTLKVSHWVLYAQENERRLTVVRILAFATYTVSTSSISDLAARAHRWQQQVSRSLARTVCVPWASIILAPSVILQLSKHCSYLNILWSQRVRISDFLLDWLCMT